MKTRCFSFQIAAAVLLLVLGFSTQAFSADSSNVSKSQSGGLIRVAVPPGGDDPFDGISFPTIYRSGHDLCTNTDGKPVVFLVGSSLCSHCEWVGEIFDAIATHYMEEGLIDARHYDIQTGDDLLTEEPETEIPEDILEIYHRGSPKDLVPYINFSCKYERVGNGHEESQDAAAEGREIMEVIETLIRVMPASEK